MTDFTSPFGGNPIAPSEYTYAAYALTVDQVFFWPSQYNGVDGLLVADILEISANAANLTFTLPLADAVSPGQDILIRNTGGNAFDVVNAANGAVSTIDPGDVKYLYVKDNTTQAGVWGVFSFGVGTGQADASQLAGLGLRATGGTLEVLFAYLNVNANYNILTSDRGKLIDITAGSITLTLPQASTAGDGFYVLIHNSGNGSAVIEGFGTETVDGSLNKTLFPQESAMFICNGTFWRSVGYGRDATFIFSEFVVNAGGGSVVLTSADVAGRMIRIAGVAVGNITVTLPSLDNIYFVNVEAGMGGFSVTFTTGSGSTVVLLASQKTVLYSDGTNITPAITTSVTSTISLDDGSAAAPSLSFSLDTDLGLFRAGANILGITAGGVEVARFSSLGLVALDDHITDPTDAHDASAISNVPAGGIAATDVQAALNELDTEKAALASPVFTGNPTAPTPAVGDDDTSIATTAFVMDAFADGFGGGSFGFKNKIINPTGRVFQRAAAVNTLSTPVYFVDRWFASVVAAGAAYTANQAEDGSLSQHGVHHFYLVTTTTKAVLAAGDNARLQQSVEGFNIADFRFGFSDAKTITLSFRARSAVNPMTMSIAFRNGVSDKSYVTTVALTTVAADYKVTVPGETTGGSASWVVGSLTGMQVSFTHACGTTLATAVLNAWQAGNFIAANTQTNGLATLNEAINITDIQLEIGDEATPLALPIYSTELALCQRYYFKTFPQTTAPAQNAGPSGAATGIQAVGASLPQLFPIKITYPVAMRTDPTVTTYNPQAANAQIRNPGVSDWSATSVEGASDYLTATINGTTPAGTGVGSPCYVHITADAEL